MADEKQPDTNAPPDDAPPDTDAPSEEDLGSSATLKADSRESLSNTTDDLDDPRDEEDLTGQSLSERYTVLEKIGTGGMSVVYLARHELLKKKVAVKVLRAEQAIRRDGKARFHREAKAAASIADPHIVDITDYGFTERGNAFIVMERLEGADLRATVVSEGAMAPGRAVAIARQTLRALRAAHDRGIIHRDLKAENVFLCQRDGKDFVKLLDFGISKVTQPLEDDGDAGGLTTTGQVLGTPQYLAPEQAHGIENVDLRADLYAMGVILYEMLTGQLPFTGKSVLEVVMKHIQEPPQPPSERRPDLAIPRPLERVVLKAMTKDPDKRYSSAQEMLDALPSSDDLPGGYTSQSLTPAPAGAARPRSPFPLVLGGALAALLLVGAWFMIRQGPARKNEPALAPDAAAAITTRHDLPAPDTKAPPADTIAWLTLKVIPSPANAVVFINDKRIGVGRVQSRFPRGETVEIKAQARGYRVKTVQHKLLTDTGYEIHLQRIQSKTRPKAEKGSGDLKKNPYR